MKKYLSVCSGIEAASVAWHPLGWEPVAFAEIEKFPSAVLAHHYPDVPNLGDMTKFKEWPDAVIDVLVGGTPCQSFSVAGLRKGLADPRGNLCLTYLAIADRYRPEWLLWENVPGVLSSDGGRDFGAFLGGLGQLGYGWSYRVLDAQYVRVDGFGRAVPQRRRRVFVVGHLGDWRRAAAVLFERESLQGNTAPRRQAGQGSAATVAPSLVSSGRGVERTGETRGQDPVVAVSSVSHCLNAGGMGRQDYETETLVAHSLRADGFDASEDGTGRGTPLVAVAYSAMPMNSGKDFVVRETDVAQPLMAAGPSLGNQGGDYIAQPIAFSAKDDGGDASAGFTPTLMGQQHSYTGHNIAVAFQPRFARNGRGAPDEIASALTSEAGRTGKGDSAQCVAVGVTINGTDKTARTASYTDVAGALRARTPGSQENSSTTVVQHSWAVRRLTPRECERLQGFPDDYTLVPSRGKPAADGPRYKALGNSMAVNCMRWIGRRIEMVSTL